MKRWRRKRVVSEEWIWCPVHQLRYLSINGRGCLSCEAGVRAIIEANRDEAEGQLHQPPSMDRSYWAGYYDASRHALNALSNAGRDG